MMEASSEMVYYQIAWDIMLSPTPEARLGLIAQAMRDFDHESIVIALSLAGLTMKSSLDYHEPNTPELREGFLEMAREEIANDR